MGRYSLVDQQERLPPVAAPGQVQQVLRVWAGEVQGLHHVEVGLGEPEKVQVSGVAEGPAAGPGRGSALDELLT